jgi:Flp pilus assembly pilin Flp
MIAATEPIGGAATPKTYRRFSRRDQTQRPQDQQAHRRLYAEIPLVVFREKYARGLVRLDVRREVNQMLKLFTFVQAAATSLRRREEGQTMAEYGVVLAVITLAVIGAITLLSDNVRSAIESVANILPG